MPLARPHTVLDVHCLSTIEPMACGVFCGIGQAFLSGSAMAYASIFAQPRYLQAVSGGQGIAGLTVTLASMFIALPDIGRTCASSATNATASAAAYAATDASLTTTHARALLGSAVVYFGGACGVTLLCILGFLAMEALPFTKARKMTEVRAKSVASYAKDGHEDGHPGFNLEGFESNLR